MTTPHEEHDPAISALYRKTGNVEPPAKLDEAVLATARRNARQHRNRWMLPLSTAAVLVLGITVLLKINSEWLPVDSVPVAITHEEKSDTSAGMLAKKAAPASPKSQALRSAPPQTSASAKSEIAETLDFSADSAPVFDSAAPEAEKSITSEAPLMRGMATIEKEILAAKPWIENIQKLLQEKKPDEAKKELQAFRKHYPDYKLPDNLKVLLP